MRIESLSTKSATIAIFSMIGVVAIVLSLFAGSYFRQSALDAQMKSLSRVIEVAAREMLKQVGNQTFELGMKLGHSKALVGAARRAVESGDEAPLVAVLDDPFISGFVGFSRINLVKLRVFDLDLRFVAESRAGRSGMERRLAEHLSEVVSGRSPMERLKGVDALWLSSGGPLFSALVPVGGLRPVGYLEVVIDPAFNMPDIGKITQTPVSVYTASGEPVNTASTALTEAYLPVEYVLQTSDGIDAFRIVGLENVATLNREMYETQAVTISGFLVLALATLLLALWLFNRFMLSPLHRMAGHMRQMAQGRLDLAVNSKGLSEFHLLADNFNAMANQVRMRTNDLERLLDLDDSAIVCFDSDQELVFFNRAATALFDYSSDEISDLDMSDLFVADVRALMSSAAGRHSDKLHTLLDCRHKDGHTFKCDAVINTLDVMGQSGHAIALNTLVGDGNLLSSQSEQRLGAVEQSLSGLLAFARSNPSLLLGLSNLGDVSSASQPGADKALVREQAVNVMNLALACWEHDLGRSKLDLAEMSRIWPVYIDKSTPTTRTLDKYLNLDSCPKNPRSKRVVDTAEFVLRQVSDRQSDACCKLQAALDTYRQSLAGIRPAVKPPAQ